MLLQNLGWNDKWIHVHGYTRNGCRPSGRDHHMNIQIFGTKKCNDTKKAEQFFKKRGIKYQFIDMKEKGMYKYKLLKLYAE